MKRSVGFLLVSTLVAFISIGCSDSGYTPTEYDPLDDNEPDYMWTRVVTPTTSKLNSIAFVDTFTGICVGEDGTILRTLNSGITWDKLSVPGTEDIDLKDIVAIDKDHFQAVGVSQTCSYRILTKDGGANWTINSYCPEAYANWSLTAVACSDYDNGVMVGLDGLVANFQSNNDPIESGTDSHLSDAAFSVGVRYYAVGSSGVILMTEDGGASWETVPSGVTNDLTGIDMLPINVGFIVGSDGIVLRGDLNGWEECQTGTGNSLLGVSFRDEYSGIVVGSFGTVLRTDDGGETWDAEECNTSLNLRDVYYGMYEFAIAVGDSGAVFMRDSVIQLD